MNPQPCSGHGFGCGCATSQTAGAADCQHVFRNPSQTYHGTHCGRCGISFADWGKRLDAEIADIVDQRQTD